MCIRNTWKLDTGKWDSNRGNISRMRIIEGILDKLNGWEKKSIKCLARDRC